MADDDIISNFGNSAPKEPTTIDFSALTQLEGGGSTCDIYKSTIKYRQVFIKRLKDEYRNNPIYKEAFRKEYEICAGLKHSSIPQYRDLHDDYLVIDWVDGKTLADMIKVDAQWLRNPKNIVKMLGELVDVVEYLHDHNIIHSDIKPDNIMITAGTHNLMLIDFDKAYKYSLSLTAGDARNYDVEKIGDPAIDFHGIGMIVDRLQQAGYPTRKLKNFRDLCWKDSVIPDELKAALTTRKHNWLLVASACTVAVIAFGVWVSTRPSENAMVVSAAEIPTQTDTVIAQRDTVAKAVSSSPIETVANQPLAIESYKDIINREMVGRMKLVIQELKQAESLQNDSLFEKRYELIEIKSLAVQKAYKDYMEKFRAINPIDVQTAVAGSKSVAEADEIMARIMARLAKAVEDEDTETSDGL